MTSTRLDGLPTALRERLKQERLRRGWSQRTLGEHAGLPQVHISGIETGRTVPRYDTLLDLVRVLGQDLVLVPRELVPAVRALIADHDAAGEEGHEDGEQPLYGATGDEGDAP